ncbi:MAG: HPr family phosphocarrier protein [Anderseniella sp.]|nr:HPr family phosphocarrier protein [Anderseniella sp.]
MTMVRELEITNRRGLHARASAKFVKCVEQFDVEVTVSHDGQSVPGTSILGLMMLAASTGTIIKVAAAGKDANAALDAITALLADRFGEDREDNAADTPVATSDI